MRIRQLLVAVGLLVAVMVLPVSSPASAAVPGLEFTKTGCEGYSDSVARLYTAGLGRKPEKGGFDFWMAEYTSGRWGLKRMAAFFTQSPEFAASYGALDQDGFVRQIYRNVLGREGEAGGVAFWNDQMSAGMDRGTVLLRFSESPENIATSGTSQPALGHFNEGLSGPWGCNTHAAPASSPPPNTQPAPQSVPPPSCDPNYSGCVPIDSDVDCLGGSGNGPSYVAGPVRVIGRDIYRLDADGDGIGCE